ncbi:hypothetical protein DFH11DRAFT_773107 [Phellopilus nigrolimitatus]|nr:hypothetical protein DFH11DRAFT_773107 [Phellopilus nigrolimitatus]
MTQNDSSPSIPIFLSNHTVPDPAPNAPYLPSDVEAANYFYGLPSKPRLIARSSCDVWMKPTGLEAYLIPKELTPLGPHLLNEVWEGRVGPAMDLYLQEKLENGVQWTTMTPLRIGIVGQPFPPAVILVGVEPGSLSHELGIDVALGCRSILVENGILDIHVEIRESKFTRAAMMYKPALNSNPAAALHEPFSTSLGLPICNAKSTNFEGTGGFFFIDSTKPGALFMLTARHVLFNPHEETNELYRYKEGTGAPRRLVMLLGENAFKARVNAIKAAIGGKGIIMKQVKRSLELANAMDDKQVAAAERAAAQLRMDEATKAIKAFEQLLADVVRDWADEGNRVIGHVVLSPPISFGFGDDGFTDDWAVVQIYSSKISKLNFVGNAIDLGSIAVDDLTAWMYPHTVNPGSFDYPGDRLLKCHGTVSDQEMFKPHPGTQDHDNNAVIMVLKRGNTSGLTVGRLNTIRSFVREPSKVIPSGVSREVAALPRNSKSGAFSEPGDSGAMVVDAVGRICGILTGGDGAAVTDCTFVTSINFLLKRLHTFGFKANIFPLAVDL